MSGVTYGPCSYCEDLARNGLDGECQRCARAMTDALNTIRARQAEPEAILQFFAYAHLPPTLQDVSAPFGEMAHRIVATLPRNSERTVALRKLLESKDAAVRALVART